MDYKKTNLNFHQTFKPERKHICSIIAEFDACNGCTAQEISLITGIPTGKSSGKVEPTISYLEYMGVLDKELSNKQYNLKLTKLGEAIRYEDPGLIEDLSLLLLHCMLSRPYKGATLWAYIVNELLDKYHKRIDNKYLTKELSQTFSSDVNMSPFNGSYSDLFQTLDLIKYENNELILCDSIFNEEFIYLYGYILYEYWNNWFEYSDEDCSEKSLQEITAPQLDDIGFNKPFGWNKSEEYKVLEELENFGIISLNRQMAPFTVRRIMSQDELVELLYSNLC